MRGPDSSVLPPLSAGIVTSISGLFMVAHENANLFPTPFKANFENRSRATLSSGVPAAKLAE
jgi:hypothetical protein